MKTYSSKKIYSSKKKYSTKKRYSSKKYSKNKKTYGGDGMMPFHLETPSTPNIGYDIPSKNVQQEEYIPNGNAAEVKTHIYVGPPPNASVTKPAPMIHRTESPQVFQGGPRLTDPSYPTPKIELPSEHPYHYNADKIIYEKTNRVTVQRRKKRLTETELEEFKQRFIQEYNTIIASYLRETCKYSNEENITKLQNVLIRKFQTQSKAKTVDFEMKHAVIPYLSGLKNIFVCLYQRYNSGFFNDYSKFTSRITYLMEQIEANPKLKLTKKYEKIICDDIITNVKQGGSRSKKNRTRNNRTRRYSRRRH
jgi:hypothetical protein